MPLQTEARPRPRGMFARIRSAATDFRTWPWQITRPYVHGDLGLRVGATKPRCLEPSLGAGRTRHPGSGSREEQRPPRVNERIHTGSQVHDLDWWDFPMPPCCKCSLDLSFKAGKLTHFERHCDYAPEGAVTLTAGVPGFAVNMVNIGQELSNLGANHELDRCTMAVGACQFSVACQQWSGERFGESHISTVVCAQGIAKLPDSLDKSLVFMTFND
jgi:hypothetical protein